MSNKLTLEMLLSEALAGRQWVLQTDSPHLQIEVNQTWPERVKKALPPPVPFPEPGEPFPEVKWEDVEELIREQGEDPDELLAKAASGLDAWRNYGKLAAHTIHLRTELEQAAACLGSAAQVLNEHGEPYSSTLRRDADRARRAARERANSRQSLVEIAEKLHELSKGIEQRALPSTEAADAVRDLADKLLDSVRGTS